MAPHVPSLAREAEAWAAARLLVGVDEAGRGPLAGPVVAAAVVFPAHVTRIRGIRDSKVLSEKQRLRLLTRIRERALRVAVAAASVREIDRYNIRVATAIAMRRAIARALVGLGPAAILIDGLRMPEIGHDHEALIDGDAKCMSIAAAGIVAKTVRDKLMRQLANRHPFYSWETNMGYSTEAHLTALRVTGPCVHHRREFSPVAQLALFAD